MPRGGAHFSSQELAKVLSHYEIGVINQITPLAAGNRRSPKMVVISEQGKFLIKRRPRGKDDLVRISFAHAVQNRLAEKKFPVTTLVPTCDENNTVLRMNNHFYECFKFVTGSRYDGSANSTIDAGRQLAKFHQNLLDFSYEQKPSRAGFHDSATVRRYLKMIGSGKKDAPDTKLEKNIDKLMSLYNNSSACVNQLGFDAWKPQIVHGDWHPGNMLFSKSKLIAVLDFDSVKIAPAITDLANGMLQFSIVGNRPNPADWPAYFDQAKIILFLNGYQHIIKLDKQKLDSLVYLMIETIIAEAVLPIATTGFFGNLTGADFLHMIRRKAEWLNKNRDKITQAIET